MIQELQIINKVNGQQLSLAMDGSTQYVLDEVDWDVPLVSFSEYRVPYQIGVSLYGVEIGTRKPSITGYVVSNVHGMEFLGKGWNEFLEAQLQDVEQKKYELNRVINPLQDIRVIVGDYFIEGRPSSAVKFSNKENENNEVLCMFTIDVNCFSPMFRLNKGKQVVLAKVQPKFRFPLILKETGNIMGVISNQKIIDVVNNGDCDIGGIIKLEAVGGTVQNPTIFNINTNEQFMIRLILQKGDYLLINTKIGEENVIHHHVNYLSTGKPKDENVISDVIEGSTFLQFKQGSNLYGYSVEQGRNAFVNLTIDMDELFLNLKGM
jgi:hypothetical protein